MCFQLRKVLIEFFTASIIEQVGDKFPDNPLKTIVFSISSIELPEDPNNEMKYVVVLPDNRLKNALKVLAFVVFTSFVVYVGITIANSLVFRKCVGYIAGVMITNSRFLCFLCKHIVIGSIVRTFYLKMRRK